MFQKVMLHDNPITMSSIQQPSHGYEAVQHDFKTYLKNALQKVSEVEKTADIKQELLIEGRIDDLHHVMISAQKASITVEAAVQIQQKVIDSYNEIMRMQI